MRPAAGGVHGGDLLAELVQAGQRGGAVDLPELRRERERELVDRRLGMRASSMKGATVIAHIVRHVRGAR